LWPHNYALKYTVSASFSGGFDFGTRSGSGVNQAPEMVKEPPTAFAWMTFGWQFKAAACAKDFVSCGTTAQARL
jgi:hypothetical protein